MTFSKLILLTGFFVVLGFGYFAWKMTSRSAYETAPYTVLKSDGPVELREYPALTMAVTEMQPEYNGEDGSFMRLFKYISGENNRDQKIAMTTPVFMEQDSSGTPDTMGFVLPQKLAETEAPSPASGAVQIQQRSGGQYAAIRFTGRINPQLIEQKTSELKMWIEKQGLTKNGPVEVAGYDAPWTPGPFRRNEVLIPVQE